MSYFISIILFFTATTMAESKVPTIAIVQEWSQFNPVNVNLASTQALQHFVVRDMIKRDITGKIIPDLAENIPSTANKQVKFLTKDGTRKVVADWKIKANAKWGDGTDVTCKDWWTGWQIGLNPNVTTEEKNRYKKIENIEWQDSAKKSCKVTYATDDWTFDRDLPPPLPAHLETAVFEKWKNQNQAYDQNSLYVKEPTQKGLYNGPYVVEEFKLGSHIIFKANSLFYGEKPSIEKLIVKHVGDTSALRAQLKVGGVDIISSVGFPLDTALILDAESKKSDAGFKVQFQPSPIFQGLFFNLENEFLKDPEVRKALSYAINKKEISKAFFENKVEPAESIFSPMSPAHKSQDAAYNFKKASQILDQAGWKLNAKNTREKNGKELVLGFRVSAGIKNLETIQGYICNQFQKLGVKCLIQNQPPRVFLGETVPHGDFAIAMFGQPILPDISLTGVFSSKEIPSDKNGYTGQNVVRWKSPKMDTLLDQFDKEWDASSRKRLLQTMDTEIRTMVPFIPIYHRKEAIVIPKNLKGYTVDVTGMDFTFPEKWKLD